MTLLYRAARRSPSFRRPTSRPFLEQLETRDLLSASGVSLLPIPGIEPNDTLNVAQRLGVLDNTAARPVSGQVGNGSAGAADVDWFSFSITAPTHVHLSATADDSAALDAVLSLYNTDPGNTFDPNSLVSGHRLLTQVVGTSGTATLDRDLAAGTYYVAVSGKGNQFFYPLLADSGLDGTTGGYLLQATGTTLVSPPLLLATDLDAVTVHDAAGNPVLDSSPLVLHYDTSVALDPISDVHLFDNFGDELPISFNIDQATDELQIMPVQALAADPNNPYQVVVFNSDGSQIQFTQTFVVAGVEGNVGTTPDDFVGGAHNLGDVTNGQIVQATGAIGVDPFYDPINAVGDPNQGNPANQVDLYRFHVGGTGNYALDAEVFAGRIGSPLAPTLTLFRLDAAGQPIVVAGNNGTRNDTLAQPDVGAGRAQAPLLTDPTLFASLTPGDYLLAVSTQQNYSNPVLGLHPGQNGSDPTQLVFDPTQSHSGTLGGGLLGNYVLNLRVQPAAAPPRVVAVTVSSATSSGTAISGSPTEVDIRFSGPVNLQQLAFQAFQKNLPADLPAVFIHDTNAAYNSAPIVPRLVSYDASTFEARFILLDRLPTGTYQLHVAGNAGFTDFSGTPVAGNTPAGDWVATFTVANAPALGSSVATHLGNDSAALAQNLGVIFGHEFEQQFTVSRDFTTAATKSTDTADYYAFQVLQGGNYSVFLSGASAAVGEVDLVDAAGKTLVAGTHGILNVQLAPGTYYLRVSGWTAKQAAAVVYHLVFSISRHFEQPTPLTIGPAPALRLQLVSNAPTPTVPIFTLPLPPSSGRNITPTSGITTDTGTPTAPGLANALLGVANALAAGPIGGVRGPGAPASDGPQLTLLNLPTSTFVVVGSSDIRPAVDPGGAGDEATGDGFILGIGHTFARMAQMYFQTRDALFSRDILFRPGDAVGEEQEQKHEQQPKAPAIPNAGPDDEDQPDEVSAPAVTEDEATRGDADQVWMCALGFAGSLALYGRIENDEKALGLASRLDVPEMA